ncbi:MAG TPA: redoxin domain-containing protein [Steroidobacteraceae bacterium]|nr:redoxin domain-containing protein [Steroidobacteraceae bacterium]
MKGYTAGAHPPQRRPRPTVAAALVLGVALACDGGAAYQPYAAPEFTHAQASDWINSKPLTLAGLRGKVVLVEFWAFDCVNCVNSEPWVKAIARDKTGSGLVVVGVHTPELREEQFADNVRSAVRRLGIFWPVMMDADHSYWNALHNQYWPEFYIIGPDGMVDARVPGELHVGDERARLVEELIDKLLAASAAKSGASIRRPPASAS